MRRGAAFALVALALAGCSGAGEDQQGSGDLAWEKEPQIQTPETLPQDRILSGTIKNESLRQVDLTAKTLRVLDSEDRPLKSSAIFLAGFGRGLYPPQREPDQISDFELERTGKITKLKPGQTVALTVSWRLKEGEPEAAQVDYGSGTLPISGD